MAPKNDTALLLRVHYWDEILAAFAASLCERLPYDLYVVADETTGAAPQLPHPTIGLTKDFHARHGLLDNFPQVTWRCGDYFLYLARQQLPSYRFYWMLDHDIRLHFPSPQDFFKLFEHSPDIALIAHGYRRAEPSWDWAKTMPELAPVYRCSYALVRLTGEAIDAMLAKRQALAEQFTREQRDPTTWPNDEAFTATTLTAGGFACRDISSFGLTVCDETTFKFWTPEPLSQFRLRPIDNRVHHPVLHGIHLFNKWVSIAFCTPSFDFDWFASYVRGLVGHEWTEEQAQHLIEHANKMREQRQRKMSGAL